MLDSSDTIENIHQNLRFCVSLHHLYTPFTIEKKKFKLKDIISLKRTKKPPFSSGIEFHKYITFFPRHLKSSALLCCPCTSVKRCHLILKLKLSRLHAWIEKLISAMSSASEQLFSLVRNVQGFTAGYFPAHLSLASFEAPYKSVLSGGFCVLLTPLQWPHRTGRVVLQGILLQ